MARVRKMGSELNVVVVMVQGKGTLKERLWTVSDNCNSCPSCSCPFFVRVISSVPSASTKDFVGEAVDLLCPGQASIGIQVRDGQAGMRENVMVGLEGELDLYVGAQCKRQVEMMESRNTVIMRVYGGIVDGGYHTQGITYRRAGGDQGSKQGPKQIESVR